MCTNSWCSNPMMCCWWFDDQCQLMWLRWLERSISAVLARQGSCPSTYQLSEHVKQQLVT